MFAYASKRQTCIAMSSTEAELIAASTLALEVSDFRTLLREMGLGDSEPTRLYVDNSGALQLSRDRRSCHRSRHVDRRYFKVRELSHAGEVLVEKIDTAINPADVLTKPLKFESFSRHVRNLMNSTRVTQKPVPRKEYEAAVARKEKGAPMPGDEAVLSHAVSRGVQA